MKAIIPVAGFGTRMRPHTYTTPKVLMNVAGKPMLDHLIDDLVDNGITGVTLIVGYLGDKIEEHVRRVYGSRIETNFVEQSEMLGLGHAISLGKQIHNNDKDLLIILGDTLLLADFKALFSTKTSAIGVKEVEDPRRFGVVELDKQGRITAMHEKLEKPPSNKAIIGVYKINDPALLFKGLDHIIANNVRTKGEIQLTDALDWMLKQGHTMMPFEVEGWLDCGKPETLFETNRDLLRHKGQTGEQLASRYPKARIVSPVSIAEGCEIVDSEIGPHVVLGAGCKVQGAKMKDCIVGEKTSIKNATLHDSLIGREVIVDGVSGSLNIGDSCEVRA